MALPDHLLDTLPCGYVIFDDRGAIEYANKTLLATVGYTAAELKGMAIEQILTVSSRIFYQTHLFPLLSMKGAVSEIFLTLKSSGGARIPVMLCGKREDLGSGMRSVCTVSTVLERQKYEKQLIESRRAYQKALEDNLVLQQLAGRLQDQQQKLDHKIVEATRRKHEYLQLGKVLMHDLQEPVRKIGYYFDRVLSEQGTDPDSENHRMLAKISKSVARLRQLTDSVQRFVTSEDNQNQVTALTTEQVANEAAADFKTVTGITDFELQIEGSVGFQGRPALFATLFFASYIFGLFNKIEGGTDGVGLGLALCEQIIGRHRGRISARSGSRSGDDLYHPVATCSA